MKYLAALLLIFGFGLSSFGQTIKSLGYNTTNGIVIYSGTNNLRFTNNVTFRSVVVDPLASGAFGLRFGTNESGIMAGGTYNVLHFRVGGVDLFDGNAFASSTNIRINVPLLFNNPTNASITRTNLGLGGGITTNVSFVVGTNTNSVTISNGIITGWTQ